MANLRIKDFRASDIRTIKVRFSEDLDPFITKSNISITALTSGVPNVTIQRLQINGSLLVINTLPMTPNVTYLATFSDTDTQAFKSLNGDAFILEDGRTNVIQFVGPEEPENSIRDEIVTELHDQDVYDLTPGTIVRTVVNNLSEQILKARRDILQTKNENYLSFLITDERKRRGRGPFDRLNEEGAYEVLRVGKTETGANTSGSFIYSEFPTTPITLQRKDVTEEELEAGVAGVVGTFDKLILTLSKKPITKVTSVTFNYADGYSFDYSISSLGYQLKEPRFDPQFASTLLSLDDNQIRLNDEILQDDSFTLPGAGDSIVVSYQYRSLGRNIDESSVLVSQVLDATREPTPALTNQFSLDHAPVVTSGDKIASLGGVSFLDPNSENPFQTTHPAFTKEIPFNFGALPNAKGEYAVDYENGKVFVYGETDDKEGTGNFPPAATYKYRKVYVNDLDYTYNPDTYELVASPIRDLGGELSVKVSFDFVENLVPGTDFEPLVHKEVIDERIENRLNASNSLTVLNSPVTNAFRVFNETTGELYRITRFHNDKIFFSSTNPPRILTKQRERISFKFELNELLIVAQELTNSLSNRIFKINLQNNNIINNTNDGIASSYNSSMLFSQTDIFEREIFYDGQDLTVNQNINRLEVGEYQVDYRNGIIYVAVSSEQAKSIGTVSYRKPEISPDNPHLISVSELYHSINISSGINKRVNYNSFSDDSIVPSSFDVSDERYLNGDTTSSYTVSSSNTITVTNDIKAIRAIYDLEDLNTNDSPINFSPAASFSGNVISLDSTGIERVETLIVQAGRKINVNTGSPGISLNTALSVIRSSDNSQLLDGSESISGDTITLSVASGASPGDVVEVIYTVILNTSATPVVDYNRGDYFADYTYLADEILVSYEYGDNVLDFRASDTLNEGDEYFVTYRVGALRDTLLPNFGGLVRINELQNFSVDFNRESYRDVLTGALQSFTKGPTIPALEQIVSSVTKITPEIIESIFELWSLGNSYLYKEVFVPHNDIQLVSGKFDQGALINSAGQAITFPVSSNLRLEEGTLEMWVIPEWDGLDNDADLTFSLLKKDGALLSASNIYIGSSSFNPTFSDDNTFTINRRDDENSPVGLPSAIFTKTGLFIFYDSDEEEWRVLAKERPKDGYDGYVFSGTIESSGDVYNVGHIQDLGEPGDIVRSTIGKIEFEFNLNIRDKKGPDGYDGYTTNDGYIDNFSFDGIKFLADDEHYLFDFAEAEGQNRFSLFKDGRGYLNFRVFDKGRVNSIQKPGRANSYTVSTDISSWAAGESHHVAIVWNLNSKNKRDEMHLFIDGFEQPNILMYGGRPKATSTDRFRTVKPEIISGTVSLPSVTGNDLVTVLGSDTVTSDTINFEDEGISPGHTIEILEVGFSTYTITGVAENSLILDTNMPASLSDARFTVNSFSSVVSTNIDLFSNITVSLIRGSEEIELPGLRADIPGYSISRNSSNENVLTILGGAETGDQVAIRTLGKNHRRCREKVFIWGDNQAVLRTHLPPPINLDDVKIKKVIMPLTIIGLDNSTISSGNFVATGLSASQTTNSTEGRHLTVRVTGGNVDFSTPTEVTINGTTAGGPTSETLQFSAAGEQDTTEKFLTITDVDVTTTPLTTSQDGLGVEIKETYSVTNPDGNNTYPVIRFAYKTQNGSSLEGDGSVIVSDADGFFPLSDVDNLLVITSPGSVSGTYTIAGRLDNTTIRLDSATGSSFTSGVYDVYNISIGRSGFQNGFFFLQEAGTTTDPYELTEGFYEFDYSTYLEIPLDPINQEAHIGSNFNKEKQADAVIEEFRILNKAITDTRVGETTGSTEKSITKDFQAFKALTKDDDTLVLLHFDDELLENDVDCISFANKGYVQSGTSVNDNFNESILIRDRGIEFNNNGIVTTNNQGTIEFWVSPIFDTYNDPAPRVYFDGAAAIVEEVTSITKGTVKTSRKVSEVLSVRLQSDISNTGTEYFAGGSISSDFRTINLNRPLPSQNSPVNIAYVPSDSNGDRLTILKDTDGFIAFNVRASGTDYQVRQPVFWSRNTWHRVRASFKFNSTDNLDEIRLWVDGEERGVITFGEGLLFGSGVVFGQTKAGVTDQVLITDINFTDTLNQFFIGMDFMGANGAQARIDNLKISNKSLEPITVSGQPLDTNYSSNLDVVFPVIEDAFTTFLLDFDRLKEKITDFATLRDAQFGIFNFKMNIIDSFGILTGQERLQNTVNSVINTLKPANAKAEINIIR